LTFSFVVSYEEAFLVRAWYVQGQTGFRTLDTEVCACLYAVWGLSLSQNDLTVESNWQLNLCLCVSFLYNIFVDLMESVVDAEAEAEAVDTLLRFVLFWQSKKD